MCLSNPGVTLWKFVTWGTFDACSMLRSRDSLWLPSVTLTKHLFGQLTWVARLQCVLLKLGHHHTSKGNSDWLHSITCHQNFATNFFVQLAWRLFRLYFSLHPFASLYLDYLRLQTNTFAYGYNIDHFHGFDLRSKESVFPYLFIYCSHKSSGNIQSHLTFGRDRILLYFGRLS